MMGKQEFLEMLSEIKDYQRTLPEEMTREEIRTYFDGAALNDAQIEMVYDYLRESADSDADGENSDMSGEDSRYVNVYLEELSYLKPVSPEEKMQCFRELCTGTDTKKERAREILVSAYLPSVVPIAKEYVGKGMLLADLIQEGNLGIMDALVQFPAAKPDVGDSLEEAQKHVERFIREAILSVLNRQRLDKDKEDGFVAKAALIYEAKKALAEENGRSASLEELSEYTKIPTDEIVDIERLSKE